ncbi:MAG TPA: glycosyltransferase [Pricia sp.]|nr:glycosyltransferase [Pricia sp.]
MKSKNENRPQEVYLSNYYRPTDTSILDGIADDIGRSLPAPSGKAGLVVTVPAKNEESSILFCLRSLVKQFAMANVGIDYELYEVLVLCHNCTDNTGAICRQFQKENPFFGLSFIETDRPEINNVVAVRRVLMRIAAGRLPGSGYIVTTDADTSVGRYWVANLLGYSGSGYGMVCGRIDIDLRTVSGNARSTLELKQRYFDLRTELEHLVSPDLTDPWPRHGHNSGPNLAVRRDVYLEVGGMPPKGFLEDIALYEAVCAAGYKIRHCPDTVVTTSCRLTPRAPRGFGAELRDWNGAKFIFFEVEGLERLLAKFRLFEAIRCHYRSPSRKSMLGISKATGLGPKCITDYLGRFHSARPLINLMDRELNGLESWKLKHPLKIVSVAVEELEAYLHNVPSTFCQT